MPTGQTQPPFVFCTGCRCPDVCGVEKHTFNVTAQRTGRTVRLNLSGYINTNDERVSSSSVSDALDELQDGDTLEVHIRNLYGGSVPEGLTIYHDLVALNPDVIIDGVAASMGAVIAMAGKTTTMSKHSRLMLHRVSLGASGDPDQITEKVTQAKAWEDEIVDIFAARTKQNPAAVRTAYMVTGKDKFLTADESMKAGFVDKVVGGSLRRSVSASALEGAHDPEEILDIFNALIPETPPPTTEPNNSILMKLFGKKANAIEALKGVTADEFTPEQLTAATTELNASGVSAFFVPVTAEVKNASELQAHLDTMENTMATEKKRADTAVTEVTKLKAQMVTLAAQVKKLSATGGDTETPDTPSEGSDTPPPADETPQAKETKVLKAEVANLPHNQLAHRLIGQQ